MADIADNAGVFIERHLAASLARHRLPSSVATDPDCEDCGFEIPARRREAVPWATTCIDCQSIRDHKAKGRRR
ncbi:TraR/DksA C4-type zinc finger protein [Salinicola sp. CR57]|uniref:TraR/DksA C4-type zinc finger protein n=1 Tax=Salinicola sp. CR57 TaxID=1949086 RepID=UPI000DA16CC8|nr:TraR/DksA C4-type zinc finger protein [Salinicola sp. CR57]